jgi:hypothetical protein
VSTLNGIGFILQSLLGFLSFFGFSFQLRVFLLQRGVLLQYRFHDDVKLGHHVIDTQVQHTDLLHDRGSLARATTPPPETTPTPSQEPGQTDIAAAIVGLTIVAVVLGVGVGLLVYLIKR